jgi:hypothetical protein
LKQLLGSFVALTCLKWIRGGALGDSFVRSF